MASALTLAATVRYEQLFAITPRRSRRGDRPVRRQTVGPAAQILIDVISHQAEKRKDHLNRLADAGVNVQEEMDAGRLEVLPWTDMYVRDHRFDQEAMLASVEELIQSSAAGGYPRTRLVGHHMDWLFLDQPAVNNLVECEARLNHVLSKYDAPVICNYDITKFSASVAMDIMRTHPAAAWGWGYRSVGRSSMPIGAGCGQL
jgi:hypothetical protein